MMIREHDAGCSVEPDGRAVQSQEPSEEGDEDAPKIASRPSALNTLKKLQFREIGMSANFSREKFRGFKNQIVLDMYMQSNRAALEHFEPFMRNRSAVIKIIPVKDIIILLSRTGVGMTFSRVTNDLLAFITRNGEMTEDIFYNKPKDSLIVGSSRSDNYATREYRSIPMGMIRRVNNTGHSIFTSERVKGPLLFDAVNERALMRDGTNYKIFDLNTYSMMYKIPEIDVTDVVCSPRALLVVKEKRKTLLMVIKCAESGQEASYIYHPIESKIELLELFHEKILIEEKSKGLQIINVKKI